MTDLILSLFPGIGLLDMGFEESGFCVVRGPDSLWGGDIRRFNPPAGRFAGVIGGPPCQAFSRLRAIVEHNRRQMPDRYTRIAENLIPEFERVTAAAAPVWFLMENVPDAPLPEFERVTAAAAPVWFLMENVPDAPLPEIDGYHVRAFLLNNRWLGEDQNRVRRFSFGHRDRAIDLSQYIEVALFESPVFEYAVTAAGSSGGASVPIRLNGGGKPKRLPESRPSGARSVSDYARLQGLPAEFLSDSPFTVAGKKRVIGNGVPLPMARAVARAIRLSLQESDHV